MKKRKATRWLKRLFALVLLACGAGYGKWYWDENQPLHASNPFESQKVARGALTSTVTATGQLNPVSKVDISSQISGNIDKVLVDFNSPVKSGQVLAELDSATYEANVAIAEGNLANAKASYDYARINELRGRALRKDSLNAQAEYDLTVADLRKAEAAVKLAEASLKKAQIDLARCKIYSPVDGLVIYRNVNVGQTVAASLSAPTLLVIANDLSKMQIEANVVEADVGRVRVGQDVEFRVDAYPNEKFKGRVTQVRNAPREEFNVVAYQTIIEVSNPDLKLKPGMTANVSIIVANRDETLKIPNTALRFRPPKNTVVTAVKSHGAGAGSKPNGSKAPDVAAGATSSSARPGHTVYLLADGPAEAPDGSPAMRAVEIKTGITDGRFTEVLDGLKEGEAVVTGASKNKDRDEHPFRLFSFKHG